MNYNIEWDNTHKNKEYLKDSFYNKYINKVINLLESNNDCIFEETKFYKHIGLPSFSLQQKDFFNSLLNRLKLFYFYKHNYYRINDRLRVCKIIVKNNNTTLAISENNTNENINDKFAIYHENIKKYKIFNNDIVYIKLSNDLKNIDELDIISDLNIKRVGHYIEHSSNRKEFVFFDGPKRLSMTVRDNISKYQSGSIVLAEFDRSSSYIKVNLLSDIKSKGEIEDTLLLIINNYNLSNEFPDYVLEEARSFEDKISENYINNRIDLRNLNLITIDGETAKDFDDAVYADLLDNGNYRILVAIADVSYYVKPSSFLDKEAIKRTTSVYFPSKVLPMLPEELSNGLCSLKPNVDRLALVADIEINDSGKMLKYNFYEAVINSKARMTYTIVQDIIESNYSNNYSYGDVLSNIKTLEQVYKILNKQSKKRGAISLDSKEIEVVFDSDGNVNNLIPYKRFTAHKLIEELMVFANVAASLFIIENNKTAPFRIHEAPSKEKSSNLAKILAKIGIILNNSSDVTPKDYADILEKIKVRIDSNEYFLQVLRSLPQARYDIDNIGHFGLALSYYTHFTSPIRRYPDLLLHRIIKSIIHKDNNKLMKDHGGFVYDDNELYSLCDLSSIGERNADKASFEFLDWIKCKYLSMFIGNKFKGYISGINNFGMFVTLNDLLIDGLIFIEDIGKSSIYHDSLKEIHTNGTKYKIGDVVEVIVANVNLTTKKVNFILKNRPSKGSKGGFLIDTNFIKKKKRSRK